jgi:cupin fold WbuC family metalloprotein
VSTPYARNPNDPHLLIPFDSTLLDAVAQAGRASDRKRHIVRFHELDEPFQRMLNAVEPDSYVRPHRHLNPGKPEVFVALRGSALIVRFDDAGVPLEGVVISANGPVRGIEIPTGAWHVLVSLESGTVLYEAKEGPYVATTDKDFAAWAPLETDVERGQALMAELRAHFAAVIEGASAERKSKNRSASRGKR